MAFEIDAAFPGGNVVVEGIDGETVRLKPDLRDTEGGWFYWCFRVRGAQGRTIRFVFTEQDPVGVRGPAVSLDGGVSWRWLSAPPADAGTFSYAFPPDASCVRFATGFAYTRLRWERFLGGLPAGTFRRDVLCLSRKGRPVERLFVGRPDGAARCRILLTARHHCCEMMAGYVLDGFVEAACGGGEDADWFRENAEAAVIPFADTDGVEDGDQGKNRRPHDHNRDYSHDLYPETRAIRDFAPGWFAGRSAAMMDFHCPCLRGEADRRIWQVGQENPAHWAEQQRLGRILAATRRGPLPYCTEDEQPFGQGWNQSGSFAAGLTSARWAGTIPGIGMTTTFEVAYADARGVEVTDASARAFGRDLFRAVRRYLEGAET